MKAIFVRHRFKRKDWVLLETLWKKRLIAVMYENKKSTRPQDYNKAGSQALSRMWSYCESGAIVGADYRLIRPSSMLVGRIRKGSSVRPFQYVDPDTGKKLFYKVVELKRAREVPFIKVPILSGIQPQQGTITGWPSAQRALEAIVRRRPLDMAVDSLHPSQLEVICFEYLRQCRVLRRLLVPIGRNLLDVDIAGIDRQGKTVLAQVTHSKRNKKLQNKLDRLSQYGDGSARLYVFGPDSIKVDNKQIKFIAIERVFQRMTTRPRSLSSKMIQRMLLTD